MLPSHKNGPVITVNQNE